MSELSYSYSDMLNDFDGSNYGSSKMRLSGANQQKQQPPQIAIQSNFMTKNETIEEDTYEENKSSSHGSESLDQYSDYKFKPKNDF